MNRIRFAQTVVVALAFQVRSAVIACEEINVVVGDCVNDVLLLFFVFFRDCFEFVMVIQLLKRGDRGTLKRLVVLALVVIFVPVVFIILVILLLIVFAIFILPFVLIHLVPGVKGRSEVRNPGYEARSVRRVSVATDGFL